MAVVVAALRFEKWEHPTQPPLHAVAITGSDTDDLATVARELQCTTGGTVRVTHYGDDPATHVDLTMIAGISLIGFFRRVWSTGTTAGGIVARS